MTERLKYLIDKKDNIEIVRDEIAAILVLEVENQKALAVTAGKDPEQWDLKIFLERSNNWESFFGATDTGCPEPSLPVVNIWVDSDANIDLASTSVGKKYYPVRYNIDCYAQGRTRETEAGHTPGDMDAAFEVQRTQRLVRNILMAGQNTYLGLRGVVGKRNILSRSAFQPNQGDHNAIKVSGFRLVLEVSMDETVQEYEGVDLDLISTKMDFVEGGQVVVAADFEYNI